MAAVGTTLSGEADRARRELSRCWDACEPVDHGPRCVIAHYLADLQPDLEAEVEWDERALAAYAHVADGELAAIGIPSASALAPSLHLNLGDGYRRQGRLAAARVQHAQGVLAVAGLPDDGYSRHLRAGLTRLGERIGEVGA
ncbi:hypothetical protein [Allobranchiibius sp. GilTou73]|uniref:hypothetical protein n=1 Tax=Allobranchiibius sp. GilTou73 TaxID=2904523 RepID=UPI001F42D2B8|nr:hypothetical protein [Allobranchiibius sp. GilTou73]UIJ34708.1 hypothetical protein LVQ62_16675 [Allobranchiibius sp. GilTou73]